MRRLLAIICVLAGCSLAALIAMLVFPRESAGWGNLVFVYLLSILANGALYGGLGWVASRVIVGVRLLWRRGRGKNG